MIGSVFKEIRHTITNRFRTTVFRSTTATPRMIISPEVFCENEIISSESFGKSAIHHFLLFSLHRAVTDPFGHLLQNMSTNSSNPLRERRNYNHSNEDKNSLMRQLSPLDEDLEIEIDTIHNNRFKTLSVWTITSRGGDENVAELKERAREYLFPVHPGSRSA